LFNELFRALDIGCAPNASVPPRRKPNLVTDFVDTLPNPVDPTETKRFIDRFWPCDAPLAGLLFVKPDPELSRRRVILLQPLPEIGGRLKKFRFNRSAVYKQSLPLDF
jgi:hypothetical protein